MLEEMADMTDLVNAGRGESAFSCYRSPGPQSYEEHRSQNAWPGPGSRSCVGLNGLALPQSLLRPLNGPFYGLVSQTFDPDAEVKEICVRQFEEEDPLEQDEVDIVKVVVVRNE